MGWTGPGLDRSRAHLHLEITFQINPKFEEWVKTAKPGRLWEPNRHGQWNGLNLMGIDPAPLLLAARQEKPKTWREALAGQPGGFVVRVAAPKTRVNWTDWVQVQENCTGQETWEIEMTPWARSHPTGRNWWQIPAGPTRGSTTAGVWSRPMEKGA